MRKKFFAMLFVAASAIGFTSCNSDDSSPVNNPPANTATFTATLDGEAFTATQATAVQEDDVITITGIRGDNGEKIELVAYRTSPGTSASMSLKYFEDNDSVYENYHMLDMNFNGYVTLSEVSINEVSGTFSFIGYLGGGAGPDMGVHITNGRFNNIPLTIISGTQTNTESLFAIVDGVETYFDTNIGTTNNAGMLLIHGLDTSVLRSIGITVPQNISVGNHAIGGLQSGIFATVSGIDLFDSVSGTLTITNNSNGWLTGSFSFTGQEINGDMHEVTAGYFHVAVD